MFWDFASSWDLQCLLQSGHRQEPSSESHQYKLRKFFSKAGACVQHPSVWHLFSLSSLQNFRLGGTCRLQWAHECPHRSTACKLRRLFQLRFWHLHAHRSTCFQVAAHGAANVVFRLPRRGTEEGRDSHQDGRLDWFQCKWYILLIPCESIWIYLNLYEFIRI